MPIVAFEDGEIEHEMFHHLFWAKHIFINLQPFDSSADAVWKGILSKLTKLDYRRIERITVSASCELDLKELDLETEHGRQPQLDFVSSGDRESTMEKFMAQLSGDVVN